MASGTITLTRNGSGYLQGQMIWSSVSNGTAANTSNVTAQLQIRRSALNTTTGTFKGTFTVGGISETISWYGSLPSMEWVTIKTVTATVSHNADGTGSCYLYAIVNGPKGTTMEGTYVSGSATVTLDKIPRYAAAISATDFSDEGNPVLTYTNPAGTAIDVLQACISVDGSNADVSYRDISKTGTSYTFSLTEAERNALRAAAAKSNTLPVYVHVWSKIGSAEALSSVKATMTVVNAAPVLETSVVDANSAAINLTGDANSLIALFSRANVTIRSWAKKYAEIVSQKVEHGAATLTDSGTLSITNHPIKFSAMDSRGNQTVQYASNTIIPYINPTCIIGNNIPEADGSFSLVATGLFYNGSFGAVSNSLTVQYRYKPAGGNYGKWISFDAVEKNGNGYTATAELTGLDYQTVYTFQAKAVDNVRTEGVRSAEKAVIAKPVFDWGQNDFHFNVPVAMTKNGLGVYGEELPIAADANVCLVNGWYRMTVDTVNGVDAGAVMRVDSQNSNNVVQTVYSGNFTSAGMAVLQRERFNGIWSEWKWVNPPMVAGLEYRITERYLGKQVYSMCFPIGKLPNATATSYSIPSPANGLANVVSAVLITTGGSLLNLLDSVNTSALRVKTDSDYSAYSGIVTLKYTKY